MPELNLAMIGFVIILIGFALIFVSAFSGKDAKVAVGGFIGPVPFGWANDPKLFPWIMILTAIIAIVFLIITLRGFP